MANSKPSSIEDKFKELFNQTRKSISLKENDLLPLIKIFLLENKIDISKSNGIDEKTFFILLRKEFKELDTKKVFELLKKIDNGKRK